MPETQPMTCVTEDEMTIVGTYCPPTAGSKHSPMVICLHMYNSTRLAFDPLLPVLHEAGFAVLAIDLRGHGDSAGSAKSGLAERVRGRDPKLFAQMYRDVSAAYEYLSNQPNVDPARFAIIGASVGCSVALEYATRDKSVDAIVCLTPGTRYLDMDSVSAAREIGKRPMLLIAAEDERDACDRLAALNAEETTVHIVPGHSGEDMALHGTRMFGKGTDVEKCIIEFLLKTLGSDSPLPVVASMKGKTYYDPDSIYARNLKAHNLRWFSSADEAAARGLRSSPNANANRSSRGRSTGDNFADDGRGSFSTRHRIPER